MTCTPGATAGVATNVGLDGLMTIKPKAVKAATSYSRPTKIQFHKKVRIRCIMSHKHWTRAEKSSYWYSGQDFTKMKGEALMIMKSAQAQGVSSDWEELQAVGLESTEYCKIRRTKIQEVKLSVLKEQERLWNERAEPDVHVESLAIRSQWASQSSREEAFRRAQIIAAHVHGYDSRSLYYSYPSYCQDGCCQHNYDAKALPSPKAMMASSLYVESPGRKRVLPVVLSQDASLSMHRIQ